MKKDSQFKANLIENNTQKIEPIFHIEKEEVGNIVFKENEWYFIQLPQILNMADSSRGKIL